MNTTTRRIECKIFGRVQMVMYRDFATRRARALGLTGEVWNEPDGTVSLVAEGEEERLVALIAELRKGSFLARVDRVDVVWKEATGVFARFTIRY